MTKTGLSSRLGLSDIFWNKEVWNVHKNIKRFIWLLGLIPAIIGVFLVWYIYKNMSMMHILFDLFLMGVVGAISLGLTIIAIPLLIILPSKSKKDQKWRK